MVIKSLFKSLEPAPRCHALQHAPAQSELFLASLQAAIKQLSKPFEPAQDRFEGVATEMDEDSGCVILKEAASYVSCSIKDRIEAGDHWIVYATVDGGKVLAPDAQTAVHHRKAGNHY